jgi:aminopeptidase N
MMILRLLFFLTLTSQSFADTYPRNLAVDIQRYIFLLHLNDTTNRIAGTATIRFVTRKSIRELELDLIGENRGTGMRVSQVRQGSREISFHHVSNRLKIFFPEEIPAGLEYQIAIDYGGIPADGLIISKNRYGDRTFFGDNWPDRARHWLPTIDHPYDKAAVEFIVHAPLRYQVMANGIRMEESYISDQLKLTHWVEDTDIPTKVMVIGVARFATRNLGYVNQVPVESWVYWQNREEGFRDYAPAVDILAFFNELIGPYPYRKLAHVQSTTRYGGMENASAIFYHEASITGKGNIESLIAHEAAHQWFGDAVSEADWHHVWLSEGFATYFTHLYMEQRYGVEKRKERMLRDRLVVIQHNRKSPAPIIDTRISNYSELLSPHVYERASWVLHMLRHQLGDSVFLRGIRTYFYRYKNGNALTDNFRTIMEEVSGRNLERFFRQWLYEFSLPQLIVGSHYVNGILEISVEQLQRTNPFELFLEIDLTLPGEGTQRHTLHISRQKEVFRIPLPEKPQRIAIDPDVHLLYEDMKSRGR